ncbi:MAG: hypothetical protein WKF59_16710 [Chitinophagaceae bacterium]
MKQLLPKKASLYLILLIKILYRRQEVILAAGFGIKAIITTDGMLRLTSKGELITRVEVAFYKPAIIRIIGEKERRDYSPGEHYSHMYQLKKRAAVISISIDIHDERYKEMNKLRNKSVYSRPVENRCVHLQTARFLWK